MFQCSGWNSEEGFFKRYSKRKIGVLFINNTQSTDMTDLLPKGGKKFKLNSTHGAWLKKHLIENPIAPEVFLKPPAFAKIGLEALAKLDRESGQNCLDGYNYESVKRCVNRLINDFLKDNPGAGGNGTGPVQENANSSTKADGEVKVKGA